MISHRINDAWKLLGVVLAMLTWVSCDDGWKGLLGDDDQDVVISELATELGFSKERPLVMGMNTSYAPLQYVDGRGTPSGCDVEFTKRLMHRLGIPFTFSPNHWDKMSPGILEGKYDMGMLVYSPYRKELTNYSQAVFRMYYQIAYRKKDYAAFDFRHLKGKEIAYMKSRPIGLMLKEADARDVPITDLGEAFAELAKGRYDGLICYRFQAQYHIDQLGLRGELQTDELSLEPREYCYASHDSLLIKAINSELKRMEEEGVVDEVYGDNVLTQFGVIKIPVWIWLLLAVLTFVFLVAFSINRYRLSRRLQIAHQRLQTAYDQMAEKNVALQVANEKAEESTRMKSAFIKQISHEIRTPLNVLSGFTQILTAENTFLSKKEKDEAAFQVAESTARITGLVNKMLELSDVSTNNVLERNDEVTGEYLAQLAVLTSGIDKSPHLDFETVLEEGADKPFKTHLRSAVRIVELLLDNAMKFTHPAESLMSWTKNAPKEKARLIVGRYADGVHFVVEDSGIGVPLAEAEHIFDEFVQLDEYYDGTGIGLAVARSMARRLGGDITLDTTYSGGARFVVVLPL